MAPLAAAAMHGTGGGILACRPFRHAAAGVHFYPILCSAMKYSVDRHLCMHSAEMKGMRDAIESA